MSRRGDGHVVEAVETGQLETNRLDLEARLQEFDGALALEEDADGRLDDRTMVDASDARRQLERRRERGSIPRRVGHRAGHDEDVVGLEHHEGALDGSKARDRSAVVDLQRQCVVEAGSLGGRELLAEPDRRGIVGSAHDETVLVHAHRQCRRRRHVVEHVAGRVDERLREQAVVVLLRSVKEREVVDDEAERRIGRVRRQRVRDDAARHVAVDYERGRWGAPARQRHAV